MFHPSNPSIYIIGQSLLFSVTFICTENNDNQKQQDAVKGAEAQRVLGMHLTDERIEGFCKVSVCENVTESAVTVMHHAGIGSLQPNTVSSGGVFCCCCRFHCRFHCACSLFFRFCIFTFLLSTFIFFLNVFVSLLVLLATAVSWFLLLLLMMLLLFVVVLWLLFLCVVGPVVLVVCCCVFLRDGCSMRPSARKIRKSYDKENSCWGDCGIILGSNKHLPETNNYSATYHSTPTRSTQQ